MAHTPGIWRTETSWGRKSQDDPLEYCGELIRADREIIASTWTAHDRATSEANAKLIAQAPALLSAVEKSLRWLISERDCLYEGASTWDGEVPDEDDRQILESYDRDIESLRALIASAKGDA